MANPNFKTLSAIRGRTELQHVATTPTSIVENTLNSDVAFKINALLVTNVATTNARITADIVRDGVVTHLVVGLLIPPSNTVVLLAKENPFYLNEGDNLRLTADTASTLEAVCSYEEFMQ